MKTLILCGVILVLVTSPVSAENLFLEAGPGFFKSIDSEVFLLRYKRETSTLFGLPSYYEAVLAHWNGKYRDEAVGIARAVSVEIGEEQYVSPTLGFLVLRETTDHLGTELQFYFRVAYDFKIKGRAVALAVIHISNGKAVFGWNGPNSGENFLTFSVGLF